MDFDAYMNALSSFYDEASYWRYESTVGELKPGRVSTLKEKALLLEKEYKKLPLEMQRPQVAEHIQKALALKDS